MSSADQWRTRLRVDLTAAMKARDADAVAALRGAMAAIDNAEAVALPDAAIPADGGIAGARAGVGSTEVMRRDLAAAEVRSLVMAQIGDRDTAADWYAAHGHPERAERLRREAVALRTAMAGMPEMDGALDS
ncbi:MAG: hypothetical protein QM753_02215 [Thermomicrobiales bacterium]